MAQTAVLTLLIGLVFTFFSGAVQTRLRGGFQRRPALVWLLPVVLTGIFTKAALVAGVGSLPLSAAMLAYTVSPTLCAFLQGTEAKSKPGGLDFGAILLLWLPLEFSAGARLVPRPAQGFLHSVAYGIAILLGLTLFLCFRGMSGMKYNLPRRTSDWRLPAVAFLITAPILIGVGIPIGFIPPPHLPTVPAARMVSAVGLIFAGTALPEEILFRALIQNLMMQRWGENTRTLLAAALIFGSAHLDNGPQPLPNWRYMILATIAGAAYGKVFQKSSTVVSSALLHTVVDWTKHYFF
ncbi:MAG TPA: type II CAAX endopeptidase family protein [Bryobacteraceae bacterium]|nr:type II CAAX endopeptidase family protein [Bryobacteraceae bacterium]